MKKVTFNQNKCIQFKEINGDLILLKRSAIESLKLDISGFVSIFSEGRAYFLEKGVSIDDVKKLLGYYEG